MNTEIKKEIKNQIKQLQETLTVLKLEDETNKLEIQRLQQRVDMLLKKLDEDEN